MSYDKTLSVITDPAAMNEAITSNTSPDSFEYGHVLGSVLRQADAFNFSLPGIRDIFVKEVDAIRLLIQEWRSWTAILLDFQKSGRKFDVPWVEKRQQDCVVFIENSMHALVALYQQTLTHIQEEQEAGRIAPV